MTPFFHNPALWNVFSLCYAALKAALYEGSVTQLQFSIKTSIDALTFRNGARVERFSLGCN